MHNLSPEMKEFAFQQAIYAAAEVAGKSSDGGIDAATQVAEAAKAAAIALGLTSSSPERSVSSVAGTA